MALAVKSSQRSALFYGTLAIDGDTEFASVPAHGQVYIGSLEAGRADFHIAGTADGFERLAAALMLTATEMRESALVEALGTAGKQQAPEVAA